jgi:hypothetical protein
MSKKRRKKRGRPATGQDRAVPVRLSAKLLRDIDMWAAGYRNEFDGMSRSTAIRCLILLGLDVPKLRVIDPKDKTMFEGPTPPLLAFYGRMTWKWFDKGTGKVAKRKPPASYKPTRHAQLTRAEVVAAVERAEARSKRRQS